MNLLYLRVQSDYERETKGNYDVPVPLYELEPHTKDFLKALYDNVDDVKFKYELLMFPSWATDSPVYKLGGDFYTHIKLREKLIK